MDSVWSPSTHRPADGDMFDVLAVPQPAPTPHSCTNDPSDQGPIAEEKRMNDRSPRSHLLPLHHGALMRPSDDLPISSDRTASEWSKPDTESPAALWHRRFFLLVVILCLLGSVFELAAHSKLLREVDGGAVDMRVYWSVHRVPKEARRQGLVPWWKIALVTVKVDLGVSLRKGDGGRARGEEVIGLEKVPQSFVVPDEGRGAVGGAGMQLLPLPPWGYGYQKIMDHSASIARTDDDAENGVMDG